MRQLSSVCVLVPRRGCPFLLLLVRPLSLHGISPLHLARFTDSSTDSIIRRVSELLPRTAADIVYSEQRDYKYSYFLQYICHRARIGGCASLSPSEV